MRYFLLPLGLALAACANAQNGAAPEIVSTAGIAPSWSQAQAEAVLQRTQRLHLAPDVSALSANEQAAVRELIAAGERLHQLYLAQRHPQALAARVYLDAHPELGAYRDLFSMSIGPVATTLDNTREAFLTVAPETPVRNFYPPAVTHDVMEAYLTANPQRREELLDPMAIVREATPGQRRASLATLDRHPVLDTLHPGLRARIESADTYLALPFSVAFADDILFVSERLNAAAGHIAGEDAAFARYLRLRARDLLADDYEGGDAAWVTGDFTGNLNASIGAYETYDDALYGVKRSFALSLLARDEARSAELEAGLRDLQLVEDALPYESDREVRSDIPVGVYNIIADFGQARGANTATILPNDAYLARQYGRTILMRGNILLNAELFEGNENAFDAAVTGGHHGDLTPQGMFDRTLWHEVGHYLGVDLTSDGRDLDSALLDTASLLEEMKADLVSLTAARVLHERGLYDDARLRGIYASGIRRVLQKNRPRREQPYQTMQLMQWNWFMRHGVLRFEDGQLALDYARYPAAVESLLREVLAIQAAGDRSRANAFVDSWTAWDPAVHEVIAQRMRESETTRFNLVTFEALEPR
ncbi:MAG: NUDIX hydrolase [Hyphomonadaceae bacterium]